MSGVNVPGVGKQRRGRGPRTRHQLRARRLQMANHIKTAKNPNKKQRRTDKWEGTR